MKANRIAMLGLAVLLGSTVYGNVSVIKAENDQLEEGLDAIEDAIGKGKDSDSENNSQSASEGETDMQEGTSDNTIGTPDDFPAAYDFGSGKISDFSRDYMLKKMLEPEQNDTVLNTDADPDNIQVLYLWEEGNIPAKTKFTKDMTGYFDDWDFRPYVTAIPVRKGVTPKGAVVLMAGGAYQFRGNYTDSLPTAAALREYGFQTFIVDYRLSPYTQEEGALDVARAVRFIRKNADVYGIAPDDIAVMGFSAGGIQAGEFLMHYDEDVNGTALDSSYVPDELDQIPAHASADGMIYSFYGRLSVGNMDPDWLSEGDLILKNFPETSQRSILGECRRDAFMQQEQIQWEANVWYLERLHLGKHRIDESKSLISISFMEVKEIQNREILQAYMKYELGITGQAVSTIVRRFVCIRNFIELLEQEKILAIHATVAEVKKYADGLRERGIQAKGFNERIFGIGHFYKFMEVKQYITRMPFRIEYFQQKEVVVHHDRSVEETVYMEILKKLYLFPERLRCMFLHLWCLGLRASEVCTLKGNAYYQQGEDYWIQVYQVKMKNYKRIPIPQALYQIMKVYLKKHEIQPEEFIFKNSRGGACLYGTFRTQMIEACRENKIANGEYLFQSHDYRHTVATMFYDSHVSLQSIRDYLGHTYEEMTRQYIDYMPQRIAKANDEFFEMQGSSLASWLKKEEKDGK